MSGKKAREARKLRNFQVVLGRAKAEMVEGGPGGYIMNVKHDDWCPGLKEQSILECTCSPEMVIQKWKG